MTEFQSRASLRHQTKEGEEEDEDEEVEDITAHTNNKIFQLLIHAPDDEIMSSRAPSVSPNDMNLSLSPTSSSDTSLQQPPPGNSIERPLSPLPPGSNGEPTESVAALSNCKATHASMPAPRETTKESKIGNMEARKAAQKPIDIRLKLEAAETSVLELRLKCKKYEEQIQKLTRSHSSETAGQQNEEICQLRAQVQACRDIEQQYRTLRNLNTLIEDELKGLKEDMTPCRTCTTLPGQKEAASAAAEAVKLALAVRDEELAAMKREVTKRKQDEATRRAEMLMLKQMAKRVKEELTAIKTKSEQVEAEAAAAKAATVAASHREAELLSALEAVKTESAQKLITATAADKEARLALGVVNKELTETKRIFEEALAKKDAELASVRQGIATAQRESEEDVSKMLEELRRAVAASEMAASQEEADMSEFKKEAEAKLAALRQELEGAVAKEAAKLATARQEADKVLLKVKEELAAARKEAENRTAEARSFRKEADKWRNREGITRKEFKASREEAALKEKGHLETIKKQSEALGLCEVEAANMKLQLDMANTRILQQEEELALRAGMLDRLTAKLAAAEKRAAEQQAVSGKLAETTEELLADSARAKEELTRINTAQQEMADKLAIITEERNDLLATNEKKAMQLEGLDQELERLREKYEETKRGMKLYVDQYKYCQENHHSVMTAATSTSSDLSNLLEQVRPALDLLRKQPSRDRTLPRYSLAAADDLCGPGNRTSPIMELEASIPFITADPAMTVGYSSAPVLPTQQRRSGSSLDQRLNNVKMRHHSAETGLEAEERPTGETEAADGLLNAWSNRMGRRPASNNTEPDSEDDEVLIIGEQPNSSHNLSLARQVALGPVSTDAAFTGAKHLGEKELYDFLASVTRRQLEAEKLAITRHFAEQHEKLLAAQKRRSRRRSSSSSSNYSDTSSESRSGKRRSRSRQRHKRRRPSTSRHRRKSRRRASRTRTRPRRRSEEGMRTVDDGNGGPRRSRSPLAKTRDRRSGSGAAAPENQPQVADSYQAPANSAAASSVATTILGTVGRKPDVDSSSFTTEMKPSRLPTAIPAAPPTSAPTSLVGEVVLLDDEEEEAGSANMQSPEPLQGMVDLKKEAEPSGQAMLQQDALDSFKAEYGEAATCGMVEWQNHCPTCGARAIQNSFHYLNGVCKKKLTYVKKGGKVLCDYCQEMTHWVHGCPLLASFCFSCWCWGHLDRSHSFLPDDFMERLLTTYNRHRWHLHKTETSRQPPGSDELLPANSRDPNTGHWRYKGNKPDLIMVSKRLEAEGGIFEPWKHHTWQLT